jgi:hypothetical protein
LDVVWLFASARIIFGQDLWSRTVPVTVRKTDNELPEDVRHDADSGPVIMPGYTVLSRGDWDRLLEIADFKVAWDRRKRGEPEGATLDELAEKYKL